jgi:hypothetical protein
MNFGQWVFAILGTIAFFRCVYLHSDSQKDNKNTLFRGYGFIVFCFIGYLINTYQIIRID